MVSAELRAVKESNAQLESHIADLTTQKKRLQSEKDELSGQNQSLLDEVNAYKVRSAHRYEVC